VGRRTPGSPRTVDQPAQPAAAHQGLPKANVTTPHCPLQIKTVKGNIGFVLKLEHFGAYRQIAA